MCASSPLAREQRGGAAALLLAALVLLAGCVKPYTAPVTDSPQNYLVVDGFINPNGVSTFTLSRTLGLTSVKPVAETKATVAIRDEAGTPYVLSESPAGTYSTRALQLDSTRRYQLYLTTSTGKTYQSDLVEVKRTPPIDAVTWKYTPDGVQLYVSTHDDARQSTYYRWGYVETWQYNSAFLSRLAFDKATKTFSTRTEDIYNCWSTVPATSINLGNTAALTRDQLVDHPLLLVSTTGPQLTVRYSILVQQMAQTAEEYTYWENLKRNTESIGSLYDALPSQLTGNLHNQTNAGEVVLGYVGAHTVRTKRLFISRAELPMLPPNVIIKPGYETCRTPELFTPFDAEAAFSARYLPIEKAYNDAGNFIGYYGAYAECVDCRLRGSNVKPSFW